MSSSDEEYYTTDEDIINSDLILPLENRIDNFDSANLYRKYSTWCEANTVTSHSYPLYLYTILRYNPVLMLDTFSLLYSTLPEMSDHHEI